MRTVILRTLHFTLLCIIPTFAHAQTTVPPAPATPGSVGAGVAAPTYQSDRAARGHFDGGDSPFADDFEPPPVGSPECQECLWQYANNYTFNRTDNPVTGDAIVYAGYCCFECEKADDRQAMVALLHTFTSGAEVVNCFQAGLRAVDPVAPLRR